MTQIFGQAILDRHKHVIDIVEKSVTHHPPPHLMAGIIQAIGVL